MNPQVPAPHSSTVDQGSRAGPSGTENSETRDEFLPGLQAAPFGPRGLSLQARAQLAGTQISALEPEFVKVSFAAQALDAKQFARLGASGDLREEPLRRGRLLLRCAEERLLDLVWRDPGLAPILAAHRLATTHPGPVQVMGVLNVTPDSFSDGGSCPDLEAAVAKGKGLLEAGADLLDIGAESTRPGAQPVSSEEEIARAIPVVERLAQEAECCLSIDTTKAEVARRALLAGAGQVNDISAGQVEPQILQVAAQGQASMVLMHMQGTPRTMQVKPAFEDVVHEVIEHLRQRAAIAWRSGIALPKIQVDPGIGFGKQLEHNLALIQALPELRSLGLPILLGVSRKSFLGRLGGISAPKDRLTDTAAAVTAGVLLGAEVLRIHDVEGLLPSIRVASGLAAPHSTPNRSAATSDSDAPQP